MERIYKLLAKIQKRPQLFLEQAKLSFLATFIDGYLCYNLEEGGKCCFVEEFQNFVENYFCNQHINSLNWRHIILKECNNDDVCAFDKFFEIFEEFKNRDVSNDVNFLVIGNPSEKNIYHNSIVLRLYDSLFADNKNGLYRHNQICAWLHHVNETSGESVRIDLITLPNECGEYNPIIVGDIFEYNHYDIESDLKDIVGSNENKLLSKSFSNFILNKWVGNKGDFSYYYLNSKTNLQFVFPICKSGLILGLLLVKKRTKDLTSDSINIKHYIDAVKKLELYL